MRVSGRGFGDPSTNTPSADSYRLRLWPRLQDSPAALRLAGRTGGAAKWFAVQFGEASVQPALEAQEPAVSFG